MEVKTINPSAVSNMFLNNMPKIEKRIDNQEEHSFDLIQPSEISHAPCTTSCPCSHSKTEGLKTKYTNLKQSSSHAPDKYVLKNTKYTGTKIDVRPTRKESIDQTVYHPYEYETSSHTPPTDKIVEKYTQVTDYSDEKDSNSVETSELLTNEQAPPSKINSVSGNNTSIKNKPDKTQKVNKNKFVMAELIKLGSLGIKSLSQLAPVLEKMTGGFMKRQESNKTTTTTTTVKPNKLSSNIASKRVDNDLETKGGNFPIYIPVDDMETSESQIYFKNVTLQQNFAWATENKHSKAHLVKPKIVYESPLVNGGIPISPGEIITANSDVIVGKPAVGGPLTLAASGIKLQNPVHPPVIDNVVANNDPYIVKEKPMNDQSALGINTDDSFDLRPPELPKLKTKPNKNLLRPAGSHSIQQNSQQWLPPTSHITNEPIKHSGIVKNKQPLLVNHGRPAFLDFIPSLNKAPHNVHKENQVNYKPISDGIQEQEIPDNNPSSSEIVSTKITTDGEYANIQIPSSENKPFLVDIQPSRVANVLIPHGSSTALVFAGSTEPHKTGDYIDDPLPYPEPGYFGSFSIDAPHMTNVHNVILNKNQFFVKQGVKSTSESYVKKVTPRPLTHKETGVNNDQKLKWNENKRPKDLVNIPPPTSNQETHIQIGPQITAYNPEIYRADFEKNNKLNKKPKEGKDVIDRDYENYLAVPPPPPKMHFNQDIRYDKKRYQQRPVVHTKPVQDSNTFLNIQHPISNQLPPKITSEIYFASQLPNNQATPTYTFKIPQSPTSGTNTQAKYPKTPNNQIHKQITSSNTADKSIITGNNKDNTYTVTLNTATNVASASNTGHIVGSSITVPITTTSLNGQINANIPIGTNFAIRVEDDPAKYESVALHGKRHPSLIFDNHENVSSENNNVYKGNNFEFKSNLTQPQTSGSEIKNDINKNIRDKTIHKGHSNVLAPSINSHANFPMINEDTNTYDNINFNYANSKEIDFDKRPSSFVPEFVSNSHGWYASVLNEDNIKNIKVEATTRKIIPLNFDNSSNNLPEFGEKIATVGKPPAEFWNQKNKQTVNNFSVGKPFSKPNEGSKANILPFTIRPNYIPSIFSNTQPVYDIPVRDNSEETSTTKNINSQSKPVYETAEEIYDGEEESDSNSEVDGEVSSESMKIPIITPSSDKNFSNSNSVSITESNPSHNKSTEGVQLVDFNPGTQTEKPFNSINKTTFHSNNMVPIFEHNPYMKPRPFTVNTGIPLDHQLQQPHWQINQLMENSTNSSYEDMEFNIGEEKYTRTSSTNRPYTTNKSTIFDVIKNKHKNQQNFKNSAQTNNTRLSNESNIITSTIQIQDKKPLIVEVEEESTLPTFTIKTEPDILNNSSNEIIDLSPPPPSMNYNFRPSITDEIMGMSPPPPRNPLQRIPSRAPQTQRPILPIRTPAPHRPVPPKTLPPRQSTQRPLRKPIRDEVSTYRPTYDIVNKVKRPSYNVDQPSSHLLPPPRELPTKILSLQKNYKPTSTLSSVVDGNVEKVIFPTLVSSSWLTSSNFDFSSSFNFGPTPVFYPDSVPTPLSEDSNKVLESSSEYSNEYETSSETVDYSAEKPVKQDTIPIQVNKTKEKETEFSNENIDSSKEESSKEESSKEDINKDKMKVIPIGNKNRTRKPYPVRNDDKKLSTNKFKLPSKSIPVIRPTRTLYRPEFSHPTRSTSIKKIVRPLPSRPLTVFPTSIIESSESSIDEEYIKPTEVLKEDEVSRIAPELPTVIEKTVTTTFTISKDPIESNVHKTHYGGNEIKISDEIIPTKTEFKTTIITLTKTLSEPPQIISSIGYVNLTHTLTVTHTETSLVSQSEGAVTETLILTNTQTSTIVDVVTEVYTEVQPTTIVETVTKHIPIVKVESTPVIESTLPTNIALDDITMSSEEKDNFIIKDNDVTENIQKIETEEEKDNDTFFVVLNKSQNGGKSPPIHTDIETGGYDGITRTEQVNNNGVSQVLFGEILLAGTPYLETTNVGHPTGKHSYLIHKK